MIMCPSVRPSVTRRYHIKTAKRMICQGAVEMFGRGFKVRVWGTEISLPLGLRGEAPVVGLGDEVLRSLSTF